MAYTVSDLIDMLEECDPDATVLMNTDGIHEYIGIWDGGIQEGNFEQETKLYGGDFHDMYVGVQPRERKGNYIILINNM